MSPISKIKARRIASRKSAREVLQAIVDGQTEIYIGYRRLYALWCANNAAVHELRPLFRLEGIEADGALSVTAEFCEQVRSIATKILPQFGPNQL